MSKLRFLFLWAIFSELGLGQKHLKMRKRLHSSLPVTLTRNRQLCSRKALFSIAWQCRILRFVNVSSQISLAQRTFSEQIVKSAFGYCMAEKGPLLCNTLPWQASTNPNSIWEIGAGRLAWSYRNHETSHSKNISTGQPYLCNPARKSGLGCLPRRYKLCN